MNIGKTAKFIKRLPKETLKIIEREIKCYRVKPLASLLILTYRCNSQCKTCTIWKRPKEEEKEKEIGFSEWKKIIDSLAAAGVRSTEVFGGNVLLRKDLLVEVLRYLREKDFIIHLPTNQIGLDDDIYKAIVSYVDYVYISTDGVGDYQDNIRGQKGAFNKSESAVSKFLRLRKGSSPSIVCNTTVSKYNVEILEDIVKYAISNNFDEIHFEYAGEFSQTHIENSLINGLKPTPYFVKQDESILVDQSGAKLLKENIKKIRSKYNNNRFHVSTVNIDVLSEQNLYEGTIPNDKCYMERIEVTVDPSGNVIACPFINNYMMGNLLETPLEEIWDGSKHRDFRKVQNSHEIEICKHCILGAQRNPGILKSIERIYLSS